MTLTGELRRGHRREDRQGGRRSKRISSRYSS